MKCWLKILLSLIGVITFLSIVSLAASLMNIFLAIPIMVFAYIGFVLLEVFLMDK